jgi:hypothetical protein
MPLPTLNLIKAASLLSLHCCEGVCVCVCVCVCVWLLIMVSHLGWWDFVWVMPDSVDDLFKQWCFFAHGSMQKN